MLDQLLEAARAGAGRPLVVRGEPGVGKTALLDYLAGRASGCRVAHAAGVESEMELAYAVLHQLLTPMLDRPERLPDPQREALATAFGLSAGSAPDRFLVGLATLSLLADAAEEHPLLCLVDDAQWLDRASAQVLGFVAHRLVAESVALVFAARVPGEELAGLPELVVEGLPEAEARALLEAALTGHRRSRSPGSRGTGCRTPRSARSSSSAPAQSSSTWARCSPSSASARAASCAGCCPGTWPPPGRASRRPVGRAARPRRPPDCSKWRMRTPAGTTRLGGPPAPCRHSSSAAAFGTVDGLPVEFPLHR